ncbi:hypothetical protein [Flavobacterium laiguense]|jgi:CMP-2-keto-3-deoxyoctulosonic acid synthetase|uniref:Uncharacterized protein n=1 Tax=Flavobacterium laiguense TaxID=2169409 RepID=A0A2U1JJG8_9FLAO|nr:hypothetical protein [Flavobacterium laiguense]PWA05282.1 hypothetical protein DB891_17205 [Flavobacterium laiguense]
MKIILKTLILFLFINSSCKAQQMVQTPNDAHKLKINEQQFINKPLKNLLKEIKPEIKTASAENGFPSYFSFSFIDYEEFKNGRAIGKNHLGIYIYVKEQIDWNFDKRPIGKELTWTKEDIEKYGNLTVVRIKVIGKD